jgi:hypothetical protein
MKKQFTFLLLAYILVSCTLTPVEEPVSTAFIPIQTVTENFQPVTPQEASSPTPAKTAKRERWMEYERALAFELLGTTEAICEWEI